MTILPAPVLRYGGLPDRAPTEGATREPVEGDHASRMTAPPSGFPGRLPSPALRNLAHNGDGYYSDAAVYTGFVASPVDTGGFSRLGLAGGFSSAGRAGATYQIALAGITLAAAHTR